MSLVPIYLTHIIFAHDLWHSQIEYLSNSIDLNRKDRATRGASACAARAIPQIFNLHFPINRDLRFATTGLSGLDIKVWIIA